MSEVWNFFACDKKKCVSLKYIQGVSSYRNNSFMLNLGRNYGFRHFVEISQKDLVLTKLFSLDKVLEGNSYPSEIVPTSEHPIPSPEDNISRGWISVSVIVISDLLKYGKLPPLSNFPGIETRSRDQRQEENETALKNWDKIKPNIMPK